MVMQYCLLMFEESLKSKESVKVYKYFVEKFIEFYKLKDYDSIIKIEKQDLQRMIAKSKKSISFSRTVNDELRKALK